MRIRAHYMLLFCFFCSSVAYAQSRSLRNLERELMSEYAKIRKAYPEHQTHAASFKRHLISTLNNQATFSCAFDSLGQHLSITRSANGNLRIFSWNEISGGSMLDAASVAQFKGEDGKVHVQQLDSDDFSGEGDCSGADNVLCIEIRMISIGGIDRYVCVGYGSGGGGHHYKIVQVYHIDRDKLKRDDVFDVDGTMTGMLAITAARVYPITVVIDTTRRTITYNEFLEDKDVGFFEPSGKSITYQLEGNVFRKR